MLIHDMQKSTKSFGPIKSTVQRALNDLPVPLAAGEWLAGFDIDHIAIACLNRRRVETAFQAALTGGAAIIEPVHIWPDEAPGGCPEVPPPDRKIMASYRVRDLRITLLAPASAGDVMDQFLVRAGGEAVHHFALTVPYIKAAMRRLERRYPRIRRVTELAIAEAAMSQIFYKLEPDPRFIELVQRVGDFDGTFACSNVRTLTSGERQNGFVKKNLKGQKES